MTMPMPVSPAPRVLADIGGTNARLAWQSRPGAPIDAVPELPCVCAFLGAAEALDPALPLVGFSD